MMIINNQVIYSDEEIAEQAYKEIAWVSHDIDKYSFIQGFLCALKKIKE